MDLDATQALDLDEYDEQEEQESKKDKKQVGQLKVFRIDDIEEKIYDIYAGENLIGRDERSDVFIPRKSLSKTHACIEVYENLHLVYDDNSKNRTRRDKMILKPQVRYELHHGDMLTLADTKCQYFKGKVEKNDDGDETGSETGSESMLPIETTRPDDGDISKDAYAVDTESETDDEKDPVKTNKPVVYSSDERLDKENAEQTSGLSTVADDSDQHKPIVPAFMYDSNDDDDDDDDKSKQTCQKSYEVKEHMDMSADSGTLAFGLVSPDEVPIIRPTSKKIPVLENTPLTLVYSPDTEDRTPDNLSLPKSKEEGNSCAATLIYGSESPYQDKSPVKGKVVCGQKDSTEKSKSRIQIEPEMRVKNASESQKDIETCDATMPVYELGSLKETPVRDLPEVVAPSCEPTMLYGPGTLKETPLNDMPEVGETPSEAAVYLPETQGFCGDHEETSFCEPTQAYLRESPVDTLKETPMVSNVSDSEEEEISQSDTDVKKALSFDDSATQAYTYNDSDATDDEEDDDLRFQATQAYPSHVRQPEKDEESKADTSSLREDLQQTLPYAASPPQHEQKPDFTASSSVDQQTVAYGVTNMETQAYDAEVEDETSSHSDMGKRSEVKHDEIEPTLPYNLMDMETQAYEAETEDTSSYTKDKPGGDHCGEEKMKTMKLEEKSASTVSDVKGLAIEPTLPYEISVMETQDYGDNEHDVQSNSKQKSKTKTREEDRLISNKRALEPTIPYDVEMETQAYCYENVDNSDTDDEGQSSTSIGKTTVGAQGDAHGKTQTYNEDINYDGDGDERTGVGKTTGDDQDVHGKTQAYMYENEDTNDEDEKTGLGKTTGDDQDVYGETQAYMYENEDTNDEDDEDERTGLGKTKVAQGDAHGKTQAYNEDKNYDGDDDERTGLGKTTVVAQGDAHGKTQAYNEDKNYDGDDDERTGVGKTTGDNQDVYGETQAYMYENEDTNDEDDEDERTGLGKSTVGDQEDVYGETQAYNEDTNDEGEVYGETQAYGLEDRTTHTTAIEVIPDSEEMLSQDIPSTEIKLDDDLINNNEPDKKKQFNSEKQEMAKDSNQEEAEIIIRPRRRGRGRVTQPSEEQPVLPDKPDDTTTKTSRESTTNQGKGKTSLKQPTGSQHAKVQRSSRPRRSKKEEIEAKGDDSLLDDAEGDQSSSKRASIPEKNVQVEKSKRGKRSKKNEAETILEDNMQDNIQDDIEDNQFSSKHASIPEKSVEVKKSTRGRRSKKNEAPSEVEDALPDNTVTDIQSSCHLAQTPEKNVQAQRSVRGRKSKGSEVEAILDDTKEDQLPSKPALTPKKNVEMKKSTRGRRSKKNEGDTKPDSLPDNTEDNSFTKPLPALTQNIQEQRCTRGRSKKSEMESKAEDSLPDDAEDQSSTKPVLAPTHDVLEQRSSRGRRSKKSEVEPKAKPSLPDDTEGNSSTIPVLAPTQDVLEQRSSRGRRSKKSEVESKLVDNLPCDTEEEPTLTPKKNEQVKRSNRGKSLKKIEVEPKVEDSLTDDTKDIKFTPTPKKNEQVKKSNRGRSSKKIVEEFKVEDSLPDNTEEDQFAFKKGKGKEKPVDQESSGMDSEELPPLELILSDKKLTKEKGKTRGKTQDIKKTPEESKKESLSEEAIGDEEVCSEPIVVKPFFSRRGRGRVTQSDDAVPGTSGSVMTEFQEEDLLSPQSVAKSISTRKGKGKKEEAIAVETETEMDITGSQNSTSSSVGSRTKTRGKGLKTDSDTTELNESQSSVSSSVESKPRGRARGRKAKATDLDDTHTPDLSESQSSTTSSVDSKTRGKGRRKTKATPLDDTQTEEFQVTPSKRNKSTKQENSPTVQSPSLRERKHTVPRIMFTGVSDKQAEKVVTSLGGTLVDSVYDCTHLITDKVRRTVKFLCGVASGQIIVQPMWLTACKKAKRFIEPESFIVSDKVAEKQYSFSLQQSHEKALKAGLLEGYKIHITKNVKPEPNQMKDIIKCAKGEYLARMLHAMQDNILVVSCEVDQELCKPALSCGIPVYSAELLLTGILRQDLQLDQNRLFEDHVNQPSTVGSRKRKNESEDGETSLKSSSSRSSKRKKK